MDTPDSTTNQNTAVVFSGKTGEYFRIWIVNMALTIVTLGIYSAWAKVRKLRYFYTHTEIAGGTFDYHANPKTILVGRVIALVMFGLYVGSGYIHPTAPVIVAILIFAIVPLLVVRSRIFRLRNTSYRGIRFNFDRNYKEAFKVYYGAAAITVISLGLAGAMAVFMRQRFAVNHSAFGQTNFTFSGHHSGILSIYWRAIGLTVLVVIAYTIVVVSLSSATGVAAADDPESLKAQIRTFLMTAPLLLGYAATGIYYRVRLQNYIWNSSTLGNNRFHSTQSVTDLLLIYLTNVVGIILTFGLLVPWAQIRLANYRAQHLHVELADDWQNYLAASGTDGTALGDEVGAAFDVDVDLGF